MFKYSLLFSLLVYVIQLNAQSNTNNIYSYYNIGLFDNNENAMQMAMGGVKYSIIDSTNANGSNFAVLPYHSKGQPIFSFDVAGRLSFFESTSNQANTRVVFFRGINFSIPFAKSFGLGFGYRPVYSKGYRFNEYDVQDGDSLNRVYLGKGNVQQTYFSLAYAPIKTAKSFVSFGLEGNFNFGHPTNVRAIENIDFSFSNAANIYSDTIRGFGYKAALALKHAFSDQFDVSFGVNYSFSSLWKTTYTDRILGYAGNYGVNHQVTQVLFDLNNMQPLRGTIRTPSILGLGMGLHFKTNNANHLRFHAEYENIGMDRMERNVPLVADTSFTYSNTTAFRLGVEITPQNLYTDKASNAKYLSIVSYRLGVNLSQIAVPNQNLNDRGMTFGFGFPMKTGPLSMSTINLGIRLGQVGTAGENPIFENYMAYQIGIMLRPTTREERWFRKYQYN